MTPGRRASLLCGVGMVAALHVACTRLNPSFVLDGDDAAEGSGGLSGTTDFSDDTTTGLVVSTTGEPGDGGTASGSAPGLETTGVGGGTTEDLPVTTGLESAGTSTGAPELQSVELQADAATCVLLPNLVYPFFGGPTDCESRVEQVSAYAGGMLVDNAFIGGGNGRPARIYLRFSLPVELADAALVEARLELHVGDFTDAGSDASGVLATTEPFLPGDLAQSAPGAVAGLELPLGPIADGEALLRELPLDLLVPGQALHLGIFPASDDGAVFAGNGADAALRPRLTISYYP